MKNSISLSHRRQEPESGVLYVVATPIGNLNDISLRAINILQGVDLVACEDTRHTQKLMNKFDIKNNLISFHKHNSLKKIPKIIADLESGKSIALVSDAGMPSICDPGEELINRARKEGLDIICIPGPCAALTAIVSSGMPSSKFIFEGFLPRKKSEREKTLLEISSNEKTTIIYESPYRLKQLLGELKEFCGGAKEVFISRELTKKHEEHLSYSIDKAIKVFEKKEILGEFTVIVKGKLLDKKKEFNMIEIKKDLYNLVNAGLSLSAASRYLANKENLSKNSIYKLY